MKVRVMCRKFECREDIHYKTQTGTSCEKCNSKAFWLGIELASSGLLVVGNGFHSSVVEHWSNNPEDAVLESQLNRILVRKVSSVIFHNADLWRKWLRYLFRYSTKTFNARHRILPRQPRYMVLMPLTKVRKACNQLLCIIKIYILRYILYSGFTLIKMAALLWLKWWLYSEENGGFTLIKVAALLWLKWWLYSD